jgi:hypothetical protein
MKTLITKVQDWAGRLAGAKTAMGELHEADRTLREQHAAAVKDRDHVVNTCAPVEEVLANLERLLDEQAYHWAKGQGFSMVMAVGPGQNVTSDGALAPRPPQLPGWFYDNLTLVRLAYFAPTVVKARLAEIIQATPYEAGAPAADRARLYAEADARVAEVERQHTDLVDAAAALDPPIELKLLPVVAERRATEAAKRKRNAAADEDRRQREAAVNARHVDPPRGMALSPYIEASRAERRSLRGE